MPAKSLGVERRRALWRALRLSWQTNFGCVPSTCLRPRHAHRRRGRSWSRQQQLAEAVGVSRQTINAIEKERYTPSLPLAIALARFFNTSVEEIFHADGKL
jgi:putative transcriptional regulator